MAIRRAHPRKLALCLAISLSYLAPVQAANSDEPYLRQALQQLLERVEKLEQRNAELEQRLQTNPVATNESLVQRIKVLEQNNAKLTVALEDEHMLDNEPEIASRLKAVEFQTLGMQKQARMIEALEGITAGVSFSTTAQRANKAATTDNTGESQLNYRADASISLPAGEMGDAEGHLFAQFRIGQGNGLSSLQPSFSSPNTTAFQLGGVSQADDSAVLLAQAWYQLDIPLPFGGFKPRSKETLTLNFGKIDPFIFFDQNAAANDETRQFLNNTLVHNPLLDAGGDIGADAYGFSPGLRIAYHNETAKPLTWGLSLGVFAAGPGANFSKSFSSPLVIAQAETQQKFFNGLDGNYRFYAWRNGQATNYDSASAVHTGWGISADQRLGDAITVFARYGDQLQGKPQFDRTISLGAEWGGNYWNRAGDTLGLGVSLLRVNASFSADSSIDNDGDGMPDLVGYVANGTERVVEIYYRYRLNKQFELSPDFQWIDNPGGNSSAPSLKLWGLRAQLTF